uniref:Putative kazalzinho kazal type serine protease inhibitor n=1 Tax=Panstrongylus lignarius TaxID=156445 RepID=A0A224Y5B6_9HEMI
MKLYLTILATFLIVNAGIVIAQNANCAHFICPLNWSPICGTNGNTTRTFGNACDLERTNCVADPPYKVVHKGVCQQN